MNSKPRILSAIALTALVGVLTAPPAQAQQVDEATDYQRVARRYYHTRHVHRRAPAATPAPVAPAPAPRAPAVAAHAPAVAAPAPPPAAAPVAPAPIAAPAPSPVIERPPRPPRPRRPLLRRLRPRSRCARPAPW